MQNDLKVEWFKNQKLSKQEDLLKKHLNKTKDSYLTTLDLIKCYNLEHGIKSRENNF